MGNDSCTAYSADFLMTDPAANHSGFAVPSKSNLRDPLSPAMVDFTSPMSQTVSHPLVCTCHLSMSVDGGVVMTRKRHSLRRRAVSTRNSLVDFNIQQHISCSDCANEGLQQQQLYFDASKKSTILEHISEEKEVSSGSSEVEKNINAIPTPNRASSLLKTADGTEEAASGEPISVVNSPARTSSSSSSLKRSLKRSADDNNHLVDASAPPAPIASPTSDPLPRNSSNNGADTVAAKKRLAPLPPSLEKSIDAYLSPSSPKLVASPLSSSHRKRNSRPSEHLSLTDHEERLDADDDQSIVDMIASLPKYEQKPSLTPSPDVQTDLSHLSLLKRPVVVIPLPSATSHPPSFKPLPSTFSSSAALAVSNRPSFCPLHGLPSVIRRASSVTFTPTVPAAPFSFNNEQTQPLSPNQPLAVGPQVGGSQSTACVRHQKQLSQTLFDSSGQKTGPLLLNTAEIEMVEQLGVAGGGTQYSHFHKMIHWRFHRREKRKKGLQQQQEQADQASAEANPNATTAANALLPTAPSSGKGSRRRKKSMAFAEQTELKRRRRIRLWWRKFKTTGNTLFISDKTKKLEIVERREKRDKMKDEGLITSCSKNGCCKTGCVVM
eukprot:GDKJ01002374.1.p1 GENE.GDKJ01002374.1~~GDKJ01002374.1.p1  ORF type:complete len:686 (+),score=212.67 GDKJ01002374.1:240-2060(+)